MALRFRNASEGMAAGDATADQGPPLIEPDPTSRPELVPLLDPAYERTPKCGVRDLIQDRLLGLGAETSSARHTVFGTTQILFSVSSEITGGSGGNSSKQTAGNPTAGGDHFAPPERRGEILRPTGGGPGGAKCL